MFKSTLRYLLRYSTQAIVTSNKNPYLSIPSQSLKKILMKELEQNKPTISQTNTLIYIGIALHRNVPSVSDRYAEESIVRKCMDNLEEVHRKIQFQQESVLAELQMGQLLKLLHKHNQQSSYNPETNRMIQKLNMLYANTYSHILNFPKQLEIYEQSQHEHYDIIHQVSLSRINQHISNHTIPLIDYIRYIRQFYTKVSKQEISSKLSQYVEYPSLCKDVGDKQKLVLMYILMQVQGDVGIVSKLGLQPNLNIGGKQDAKDVCIKLQILKYRHQQYGNLCQLQLDKWEYSYLVWVSEFINSPHFGDRLHQAIMNKQLPANTKPSTIFSYATNAGIDKPKHQQLNKWLCRQPNMCAAHEDSLCSMLQQIDGKNWEPYYAQFYRMVLKMSLGNFKWENQNIVYYYGQVHGIQDDNMEYLRRYILNTYASLGTARREIPTTSYFYKILEVTNVEKFYGSL